MAGVVGRTSRKSDKHWRDALMLAVHREDDQDAKGRPLLTTIAEACVKAARNGDMVAIKEIGDRLDGKPKQQTELTGADGEALVGIDVRIIPGTGGNT